MKSTDNSGLSRTALDPAQNPRNPGPPRDFSGHAPMPAESPERPPAGHDPDGHRLRAAQSQYHPDCFVCSRCRADGLGMSFQTNPDGSVESRFNCRDFFQGYPGLLHGGIVSALLDGAMTNCLFARGVKAMTGELSVRFILPVRTDYAAIVGARITKSRPPLYVLGAELIQNDRVAARAVAKFMEVSDAPDATGN